MIKTIGSGLSLNCITHNVSESGVGLLVSARNIDRYLNNAQLQVNIQIQLPAGLIKFGAQATHHQKLVMESASVVYFIGANITSIDARERTLFKSFVRSLAEKS